MPNAVHRSWAEIDAAALRHNLRQLRARLPGSTGVMAVVKANAYGHGVALVAPVLEPLVDYFGVANLTEALELQAIAPGKPIALLSPSLPEERAAVVENGFEPSVSNLAEAEAYSRLGPAAVHLIIDTGMGRIGTWQEEAAAFVKGVQALPGVRIAGLASHLPVADEDADFTRAQLARFHALAKPPGALRHIENSAGALGFPESAGDLVRAGLMLYGSSPLPEWQDKLRAVMTWKTRVTLVREVGAGRGVSYGRTFITPGPMRIATLAVGYADGYRRHLGGKGAEVLIRGQRCAVLGRVTMDQILIDVTVLPEVEEGEEVTLLGDEILASELAEKAGTIAWDIFTGIGTRVARVARSCESAPGGEY